MGPAVVPGQRPARQLVIAVNSVRNTAVTTCSPPYSRSRGGIAAVSFDPPGRRKPRGQRAKGRGGATSPACELPAEFVEAARRQLGEQRAFRVNQLIQLDLTRPEALADAVATEVHAKLRAGAMAVMSEIDSALRRIEHGTYGRCQRCGDPMSRRRLSALPSASLCGSCQRLEQMDGSEARGRTPRRG